MNFKSITFALVSFLLVAVSCSVENDTLMNDSNNTNSNTTVVENKEATLEFALSTTSGMTKSIESDEVKSCSIVMFDANGNILDARDNVQVENGTLKGFTFYTKVRNDLKVAIIANTTQTFANCATIKAVRETVQNATDLTNLVKYGEQTISFDNMTASGKVTVNNIELSQLAAKVELNSFKATFAKGVKEQEVKVTKVELLNAKVEAYTNAKGAFEATTLTSTDADAKFLTYASTEVAMVITYQVGAETYTSKAIKINKENEGVVESGYIYRVNVNLTVNSQEVDMNVSLSVNDWTYNKIEIEMNEEF